MAAAPQEPGGVDERYRAIVEEQEEMISLSTVECILTYVNQAYARNFGTTPQVLIGQSFLDHVPAAFRQQVRKQVAEVLRASGPVISENPIIRADGSVALMRWSNQARRNENGDVIELLSVARDVTERRRAEADLARAADLLRRTGALAKVGGWELDLLTQQITWTDEVYRIHELGHSVAPTLDTAIQFYAEGARPLIRAAVQTGIDSGASWDLELPMITAKGKPIWVRAQGEAIMKDGKTVKLMGAFQDITDRKSVEIRLQHANNRLSLLSTTDALTGVGNRRLFDQTLRAEWARSARQRQPLALLMIDLDYFKQYNDHYGHPAGDSCLCRVADVLGRCVRRGGELVARYGGEEFAMLLPCTDLPGARVVAQRCMTEMAAAQIAHAAISADAYLTVSIGVAGGVADTGVAPLDLVQRADAALYRAKRSGRARFECV